MELEQTLTQIIVELALQYPVLLSLLTAVGVLRMINKPLFSIINAVVEATTTKKDDEVWKTIRDSKAFKTAMYVIDWLGSVKVKK